MENLLTTLRTAGAVSRNPQTVHRFSTGFGSKMPHEKRDTARKRSEFSTFPQSLLLRVFLPGEGESVAERTTRSCNGVLHGATVRVDL